ncbi:MAG: TIGR04282 family arsenosugar biosynthesis glycosyltransferase [Pseudolabrys sp.]
MSPLEPVTIAVMAKAPVPGRAKTRLIPDIGAHAAAVLAERLTARAVETALAADVGPVSLWCTPDPDHPTFQALASCHPLTLWAQPDGDLGDRMLACTVQGPTLVIGSDCPALTPKHLRDAARALHDADVVLIPAEDGGYVLAGTRALQPDLFEPMAWGTDTVLDETRRRVATLGLKTIELETLWDVDTERDLARLERELPALAL